MPLPTPPIEPMTPARFPEGVDGRGWYQTNCPSAAPDYVKTVEVAGKAGQRFRYALLDDAASIVWAANVGGLELHPFLADARAPDAPLALVFDLDPGAPATLEDCCRMALALRERLAADGLTCVARTSGAKGLHVFAGLDGSHSFAATKAYARGAARDLAAHDPAVIDRMARAERAGRVLIDWAQNDASKSTVAPYSGPRSVCRPETQNGARLAPRAVRPAASARAIRGARRQPPCTPGRSGTRRHG